ncbi:MULTISPECIES: tetratricopeptide repeat protein [unclassified Prochlorococcus]|uniref:tetratricopeptide repeat protein n=1 Tax=unclassified Prochlorococcus TaxID=2627481 RepID=UPI00097CCBBF|nr:MULTISPECIES: tetratricopeptide repeat protein [unclassified Prochlorococcus]AQL30511.1 hypothetical protein BSR22_04670 [Prochlorococcus sp. RS50]AQL32546.1 hypothetical protein BS620_05995 [Prochlorococcus sp. RS01]AQL33809.1 hypothetical protein BS621_03115 [Prochlorococcus sp. RS04]
MENFDELSEEVLIRKAKEEIGLENYANALIIFSKILELNPKNVSVLIWKAKLHNNIGDYQGAIDSYSELIKLVPHNESIWNLRGDAKEKIADYKGAINDWSEGIKLDPDNFQRAINVFSKEIKLNPDNPVLFLLRGNVKYYSEDFNGAINDYYQAVKLNQKAIDNINFENLYSLIYDWSEVGAVDPKIIDVTDRSTRKKFAELFALSGDKKNEIGDFNGYYQDYEVATRFSDYKIFRSSKKYLTKEHEKKVRENISRFSLSILKNPQNKEALISRAEAKLSLYDYEGAKNDYSQVIKLDPKNKIAFLNRAELKWSLCDFQSALNDYSQVIKIDPEDKISWILRGDRRSVYDDFQGAISDYSQAIKLDPEDSVSFLNRCETKIEIDDFESAIDDYYQSVKLDPKSEKANHLDIIKNLFYKLNDQNIDQRLKVKIERIFFNLGLIKYKIGKYEDAIYHYSKSIEMNTSNFNSLINRGLAKEKLEYWERANNDYLKAKKINPKNQMVIKKLSKLKNKFDNHSASKTNNKKLKKLGFNNKRSLGSRNFKRLNVDEYKQIMDSYDLNLSLEKKNYYSNKLIRDDLNIVLRILSPFIILLLISAFLIIVF